MIQVLTGGTPVKGVVKRGAKKAAIKRPAAAVLKRPAAATTKANVGPCLKVPFPGDPTKKIAEETMA